MIILRLTIEQQGYLSTHVDQLSRSMIGWHWRQGSASWSETLAQYIQGVTATMCTVCKSLNTEKETEKVLSTNRFFQQIKKLRYQLRNFVKTKHKRVDCFVAWIIDYIMIAVILNRVMWRLLLNLIDGCDGSCKKRLCLSLSWRNVRWSLTTAMARGEN